MKLVKNFYCRDCKMTWFEPLSAFDAHCPACSRLVVVPNIAPDQVTKPLQQPNAKPLTLTHEVPVGALSVAQWWGNLKQFVLEAW